ncbi:MAG: outer membrane protein transport protein, partial [Pseudomonadota bacterium]
MTQDIKGFSSLRARLLGVTALAGLCAAVALPAGDASAAGFAIKEQSAAAQGNSFAGATAGAEDISYMFFNPAGLTRQEGNQVGVVVSYILPQAEIQSA